MKLWIGLVIGFAALVFIYNFIKSRKRRRNHTDAVTEFRKRYHRSDKIRKTESTEYSNYVTKYNSKIDYVERDKDG